MQVPGAGSGSSLVVRPITADERDRFDTTLEAEHWLGSGLVGEVMRYVAIEDGRWCALVGFGSAALCVSSRERLVNWSESQRYRRLRYLTNNQRFCVLSSTRRPNLASQVLSRTLRRLSFDFEQRWGHPVVMVETFTDPARHPGTCYKASNFTLLGETSGYKRQAGRFVHHGAPKAYWYRLLRPDALRALSGCFDHPGLGKGASLSTATLDAVDLSSSNGLLARLERVPDPRKARGIRHGVAQILAVATLASLRGARSLVAIGELAAELEEEALDRLGCRISPSTGRRQAPEESTIRRVLGLIDANAADQVIGSWLDEQVRAGRLEAARAEVSLTRLIEEEAEAFSPDDEDSSDEQGGGEHKSDNGDKAVGDPALLRAIAFDGKALRGSRIGDSPAIHLLSAITHAEGVTIAQRRVEDKSNEITGVAPLLEHLDITDTVITADPMHAQRQHAKLIVARDGHYIFGLKANQPKMLAAAQQLLKGAPVLYESHDRGHGRVEHRYLRVATIPPKLQKSLKMAGASQFIAIERERADLTDRTSGEAEVSYYVTDLTAAQAGPAALACYVRGHWTIENRSHYVRDWTYDEDRSQVRVGEAPQLLAGIRNLAISLLRMCGFANIAAGLRWASFDLSRPLAVMGL